MGQIKGTEVTSPLSPQSTDTVFPTHIDTYGRGVMSVKTIAERDAIKCGELLDVDGYSSGRRKYRMPVWVADQKKWYMLDSITFDTLSDAAKVTALADNTNWVASPSGSGGITSAALALSGKTLTLNTSAGTNFVTLPTELSGDELHQPTFNAGALTFTSTNNNYSFNLNSLAAGSIYLVSGTTATAQSSYAAAYANAVSGDRVIIKRNLTDEHIQLKNGVDIDASGYTLSATTLVADLISDDNIAVVCSVKALKISVSSNAAGNGLQLLNAQSVVTLEADVYMQTTVANGTAGVWCTNGTLYVKGNIYVLNQGSYGAVCLGISKQNIYGNIITNTTTTGIGAYCLGGTQTIYGNIEVLNKGLIASAHGFDGGTLGFQVLSGVRYTSNDLGCKQHYTATSTIFGEINTSGSTNVNAWGVNKTSGMGRLELHNSTILTPTSIFAVGSSNGARLTGTVYYAGSAPAFSNAPDPLFTFVDISPYRLLGLNTILMVRTDGSTANFVNYLDAEAAAVGGETLYLSGYYGNINITKSLTLRGTATIGTLVVGYMTAALTVNVYDLCFTGRVVVCIAAAHANHIVRFDSIRTDKFTYFEQYSLFTDGGISNVTVKNTHLRTENPYRPLDGVAAIGGGIMGYQERAGNGYGMWTFDDCVLESVYGAVLTGYKSDLSRITLTGETRILPASGKPVQEMFYVNTSTALPDNVVIVDNRTNVKVLHRATTTITFENNADYDPVYSGTFSVDASKKTIGAVVYAYLTPAATTPVIPTDFQPIGTQAYVVGKTLMYMFRVSANGIIQYTITLLN